MQTVNLCTIILPKNIMANIVRAFKRTMPTPTWFGWYHIMWLAIMLAACVLIFVFRKKISRKGVNITLLISAVCLLLLEGMKQLERSASIGDAGVIWHYPPADFPFQFCSTPMYLMLLSGILRKGKVYDAMMAYLGTYALFAGGLVMIYPLGVYVSSAFINVHTMIWHSSMFTLGFLVVVTRSVPYNVKSVLKATVVFVVLLAMGILMNVFAHLIVPNEYFNMYYIGPYFPNNFVVLQDIYQHVPWAVFLLIYVAGFFAASLIVVLIIMLIDFLARLARRRKTS